MPSLICTLFEGHYHLGAAALINSLHQHGFEGDFVCGFRGPKPAWAAQADQLVSKIRIHWVELKTGIHLTNHKPRFLIDCLAMMQPDASGSLYYLDPDIVIKAPWSIFERWAKTGVALVEDLNASMPAGHPYRLGWHELYASKDRRVARSLERYYNAGFIGLPKESLPFLQLWDEIIAWSAEKAGGLGKLKNALPHDLFHSADQDAMNMALELSLLPIHAAGPEAMDFIPGGHLLSHAAGGIKPWRGGFLREALRGKAPGLPQKCFYDYVDYPIPVLGFWEKRGRVAELKLAALLGRFYTRR